MKLGVIGLGNFSFFFFLMFNNKLFKNYFLNFLNFFLNIFLNIFYIF